MYIVYNNPYNKLDKNFQTNYFKRYGLLNKSKHQPNIYKLVSTTLFNKFQSPLVFISNNKTNQTTMTIENIDFHYLDIYGNQIKINQFKQKPLKLRKYNFLQILSDLFRVSAKQIVEDRGGKPFLIQIEQHKKGHVIVDLNAYLLEKISSKWYYWIFTKWHSSNDNKHLDRYIFIKIIFYYIGHQVPFLSK